MPLTIEHGDVYSIHADAIVETGGEGPVQVLNGGNLPAWHLIRVRGPVWRGGSYGEEDQLAAAYRSALKAAQKLKCRSVALPLISAGMHGYPKREALRVARNAIAAFLEEVPMEIVLVLPEETKGT